MIFANWKGRKCLIAVLCTAGAYLLAPSFLVGSTPSLREVQQMLEELDRARLDAARNKSKRTAFTPRYINMRLAAIGAVVNGALESTFSATRRPNCEALQEELRSALGRGRPDPNLASILCLWRAQADYVVGYDLTEGPVYSRSWIGIFGPSAHDGRYRMVASEQDTLPDKTIALALLPRDGHGELRFLAYGINWGDAHNRLTAIAYVLNDRILRPIWSRTQLPEGQLRVQGGTIQISFLSSALGPGYGGVRSVAETYRVTPTGIKLENRTERPSR